VAYPVGIAYKIGVTIVVGWRGNVDDRPTDGRCWVISEEKFETLLSDNLAWFGRTGESRPQKRSGYLTHACTDRWTPRTLPITINELIRCLEYQNLVGMYRGIIEGRQGIASFIQFCARVKR